MVPAFLNWISRKLKISDFCHSTINKLCGVRLIRINSDREGRDDVSISTQYTLIKKQNTSSDAPIDTPEDAFKQIVSNYVIDKHHTEDWCSNPVDERRVVTDINSVEWKVFFRLIETFNYGKFIEELDIKQTYGKLITYLFLQTIANTMKTE